MTQLNSSLLAAIGYVSAGIPWQQLLMTTKSLLATLLLLPPSVSVTDEVPLLLARRHEPHLKTNGRAS